MKVAKDFLQETESSTAGLEVKGTDPTILLVINTMKNPRHAGNFIVAASIQRQREC